jgi:hypothetical protein
LPTPDSGVHTAQVVGWIVTFVAFLGNLVWNWRNRLHTNELAANLRFEQHSRDNWSRLRARIESKLDELVEAACEAPSTVKALPDGSTASQVLEMLNLDLVGKQDRLARALQEADVSHYTNYEDWANAGSGLPHGNETSWDLLLAKFEEAGQAANEADVFARLVEMRPFALEIEHAVKEKVRGQEWFFEPAKKS